MPHVCGWLPTWGCHLHSSHGLLIKKLLQPGPPASPSARHLWESTKPGAFKVEARRQDPLLSAILKGKWGSDLWMGISLHTTAPRPFSKLWMRCWTFSSTLLLNSYLMTPYLPHEVKDKDPKPLLWWCCSVPGLVWAPALGCCSGQYEGEVIYRSLEGRPL